MKIKLKYYVFCVLLCVAALALSVGMFYFEMGLAHYSKLNNVVRDKWLATSSAEPYNGGMIDSDLFINSIEEASDTDFPYIGKQVVVGGKYKAYGRDAWGAGIIVNGDVKKFDKISVYYKPDAPTMCYVPVGFTQYIILIIVDVLVGIGLVFLCRFLNNDLRENTFNENAVTIMDIPLLVIIAGIILGFAAGMLVGNISVGPAYTSISEGLAQSYASHDLTW